MPPPAAIVVPTRDRPDALAVALASIAPQADEHGAEVVVVDDGPGEATRATAAAHGARYVAASAGQGLNAARNAGVDATTAPLVVFVDDDVVVHPGWLAALLHAAAELPDEVGVLTGPIRARIEDHRFPRCGREPGPITEQDFGPVDVDCPHAWGANLAIRRSALDRVGPFDASLSGGGDEAEWERRWVAAGGRVRWIAGAGLDHRRAGDAARLRSLCRGARARGRESRMDDERRASAPSLGRELRVLAGCALHGPRRRCAMGPVLTWHSLGRIEAALGRGRDAGHRAAGSDDFLSGSSGNVEGRRAIAMHALDRWLDLRQTLSGRRRRLRAAAAHGPCLRVLVAGIERRDLPSLMDEAVAELRRSRHDVEIAIGPAGTAGKFQNLNALLAGRDLHAYDWVLVIDDDVALPAGFLDEFLHAARAAGLQLAQPAQRRHSHAAWDVTRRQAGTGVRETTFVEIGPVTAFRSDTFDTLLPFPDLRMGWGLDAHWAGIARERGWRIGIVDATPIGHTLRPAAATYPREEAIAEARAFLAGRPYVPSGEVRTIRELDIDRAGAD